MVVKKEIGDLSQFLESLKHFNEVVDLDELDPELKRQWADAEIAKIAKTERSRRFKVELRLNGFSDSVDAELRLPPYSDRVEMHIPFRGRTQSDSPIIIRIAAIFDSLASYDNSRENVLEQYRKWEYTPDLDKIILFREVRMGNSSETRDREQIKPAAKRLQEYAQALNNITLGYMSVTPAARR